MLSCILSSWSSANSYIGIHATHSWWQKSQIYRYRRCLVRTSPNPLPGFMYPEFQKLPFQSGELKQTRLHSTRMHSAQLLTVSPSMHCAGGVSAPGGCMFWWGGCSGGYPSMHWGRPPLWTEFLTHPTENITLIQTSFAGGKKDWYKAFHVSFPVKQWAILEQCHKTTGTATPFHTSIVSLGYIQGSSVWTVTVIVTPWDSKEELLMPLPLED